MKKIFLLISTFLILFWGCSENDPGGNATVTFKLTDSPFPADKVARVEVTITKIEFRGDTLKNPGKYFTVMNEAKIFNLMKLTNGLTETLNQIEIPEGVYNQIRMFVGDAVVVLKDSTKFNLKIPSGASSGLKIFIQPAIQINADMKYEILLDYDISKSFVPQRGANKEIKGFIFRPVIRAVNNSAAGYLQGKVTDNLGANLDGAEIKIIKDSVLTSALSGTNGYYKIIGIPAGFYDIQASKENCDSVTVKNVEIKTSASTEKNFTLTKK